jgi:hypothetical protein
MVQDIAKSTLENTHAVVWQPLIVTHKHKCHTEQKQKMLHYAKTRYLQSVSAYQTQAKMTP